MSVQSQKTACVHATADSSGNGIEASSYTTVHAALECMIACQATSYLPADCNQVQQAESQSWLAGLAAVRGVC